MKALIVAVSTALLAPLAAFALPVCPALTGASSAYYAADTAASQNCNTVITISSAGTLSYSFPNTNPYDGSDDNYVGVINNYTQPVSSITVSGNTDIFGFDGDGIDEYGIPGNSTDITAFGANAYGGADAYFTNINAAQSTATVNFIGAIPVGGTGYFSLEEAPSSGTNFGGSVTGTSVTPEPSSLILLGTGAFGIAAEVKRRIRR